MPKQAEEKRFQDLVNANSEARRAKWALEFKKAGGKVMGVGCSYVPVEVIRAAGMLPWRVTGTWTQSVEAAAAVHRPMGTDPFYTHVLDARLKGDLDFLDGVVFTSKDDDMRRLYDVWVYARPTAFHHIMFVPHHSRENAVNKFRIEVTSLIEGLEKFGGKKITKKALLDSIKEYNRMRGLLGRLYELRKKDKPGVTGAEVLGITTAAQVMPVDKFNEELEALLPYLENRVAEFGDGQQKVRLMVSSDALDNPAFIEIIEQTGMVVMDDLDTGSRWFWKEIDMAEARKDPAQALARRYLTRPACPRMANWDEQIEQAIIWARDYKVAGVVDLTQINNYPRQFRVPMFREALQAARIPTISITRDYPVTAEGQLKTRIEAFVEMITG